MSVMPAGDQQNIHSHRVSAGRPMVLFPALDLPFFIVLMHDVLGDLGLVMPLSTETRR